MSDLTSNVVPLPAIPDDKRPLPELIAAHYKFPLAYVDHTDGKRYYAVQDWIAGVAQPQSHPGVFWNEMKKRLKKAGIDTSSWCVKLPYRASDRKYYAMDFSTAEVLMRITRRMGRGTGMRDLILGENARPADVSGYVYVLHFEHFLHEYKVGMAADLEKRMRTYRTENPPSMQLIVDCAFHFADCRTVEKDLHAALKNYHIRGEWFALTAEQIPAIEQWLSIH